MISATKARRHILPQGSAAIRVATAVFFAPARFSVFRLAFISVLAPTHKMLFSGAVARTFYAGFVALEAAGSAIFSVPRSRAIARRKTHPISFGPEMAAIASGSALAAVARSSVFFFVSR